jgi:DNA-binding ferritin-like protein
VQAHLMHFNYEAGNFLGVHKFLGKQYEKHQEQFDKLINPVLKPMAVAA